MSDCTGAGKGQMPESKKTRRAARVTAVVGVMAGALVTLIGQQAPAVQTGQPDSFRFKSGVELINVTATVTDGSGRFVPGLRKDDFIVYEDDQPQTVTHFSAERVPVSLGLALDTSASMAGDKIGAARSALDRFLFDLLDRDDEIFLYRFSDSPFLLQGWTTDRRLLTRALGRVAPTGGTAMYDAVGEAVPLAETGRHPKKALIIISDGNDTTSRTPVGELKQLIRKSEVLVYAIGIDGTSETTLRHQPTPPMRQPPRVPIPLPFPPARVPGGPGPGLDRTAQVNFSRGANGDRVNVAALRDLTDDSGGRTEIIHDSRDLDPATTSIAAELSQQYYLGYPASGKKDGRWHVIRVDVHNGAYRVRARRGYMAN
jgi:VWFA-related protein